MAVAAITSTAQAVTVPGGTPVTLSAACTFGLTQAGAATGPSISTSFTWPGNFAEDVTLWVQTATTANLTYMT